MMVVTADEEAGGDAGRQWLCREHPDVVRCDYVVNEGGGQVLARRRARLRGLRRREGRLPLHADDDGRAGHASIPRIADNALAKMAPVIEALGAAATARCRSPRGRAFVDGARDRGAAATPPAALAELEAIDPRLAICSSR